MDIMDSILDINFDIVTEQEHTAFMETIAITESIMEQYDMFVIEAVEIIQIVAM